MKNVFYFIIFAFCVHVHGMENAGQGKTLCLEYEHLSADQLESAFSTGALLPYGKIDEEGNTILHKIVECAELEKLVAIVDYYPIMPKNNSGKEPLQLVSAMITQPQAHAHERLLACMRVLNSTANYIDTVKATITIKQFHAYNRTFLWETSKKAIRVHNYEFLTILLDSVNGKSLLEWDKYPKIIHSLKKEKKKVQKVTVPLYHSNASIEEECVII